MQKAGGIIALIAGVLGVVAALLTLFVGSVGTALQHNNEYAKLLVWSGWGGLLFSFLTIILGAVCISARSRMPAAFLIFAALGGCSTRWNGRGYLHGGGACWRGARCVCS